MIKESVKPCRRLQDLNSKLNAFIRSRLQPEQLIQYKQLLIAIFSGYHNGSDSKTSQELIDTYSKITELLQEKERFSVDAITKQLVISHGLIFNMALRQITNIKMVQTLQRQLEQLLEKDISKYLQEPKKRQSSFSKIYSYIREISRSKDKTKRQAQLKPKLEDVNDKKTIREIVTKVLKPYIFYLLTVIKSYQVYSHLANGHYAEDQVPFYWKIANWSHVIGAILQELVRLGRYLSQGFQGIQVLLVFVISVDLTMFYDVLQGQIEKRGQAIMGSGKDKADILQSLSDNKSEQIFGSDRNEALNQSQLIEIKQLIAQSSLIKQHLNIIYCNPHLREFRKLFSRSEYYRYEEMQGTGASTDPILAYVQRKEKQSKSKQKRTQIVEAHQYKISHATATQNMISEYRFLNRESSDLINKNKHSNLRKDDPFFEESNLSLLSFLQSRKQQLQALPLQKQPPFFSKSEKDGSLQNISALSKNCKLTNARKVRLMHFNNDRQHRSKYEIDCSK